MHARQRARVNAEMSQLRTGIENLNSLMQQIQRSQEMQV